MSWLINEDDRQSLVALGCLALLIVVLRFWQFAIIAGGMGVLLWILKKQLQRTNHRHLERYVEQAQARHRHTVVSVEGIFHQVQTIHALQEASQLKLEMITRCLKGEGNHIRSEEQHITLWKGHSGIPQQSVSLLLTRQSIQIISPIAVEATAMKTALDCLNELRWCHDARMKLETMQQAALSTLDKAKDNPLLEQAIPSLEKALRTFKSEEQKIRINQEGTSIMLKQLADFLSVPESLRPILSVDLRDWNPELRLQELEQSFADVILLNDTFIELNRNTF